MYLRFFEYENIIFSCHDTWVSLNLDDEIIFILRWKTCKLMIHKLSISYSFSSLLFFIISLPRNEYKLFFFIYYIYNTYTSLYSSFFSTSSSSSLSLSLFYIWNVKKISSFFIIKNVIHRFRFILTMLTSWWCDVILLFGDAWFNIKKCRHFLHVCWGLEWYFISYDNVRFFVLSYVHSFVGCYKREKNCLHCNLMTFEWLLFDSVRRYCYKEKQWNVLLRTLMKAQFEITLVCYIALSTYYFLSFNF